jgi:FlaG/FlaF family flagellin (archaellin)
MKLRGARPGLLAALLASLCTGFVPTAASATPAVSISPLNGTPDASPYSQISILGVAPSQISGVSVTGSRTGRHGGKLEAYASAPGASFVLAHPFTQGETVTASAQVGPRGHQSTVRTTFTVERYGAYAVSKGQPFKLSGHGQEQVFQSQPSLHPPVFSVTANSAAASPGDIFLTPTHGYGQTGPMIVDPQGQLVWFHAVPKGDDATDFQVETYQGRPVLVWWEGQVPERLGVGFGRDEIVDSSYRPIASVGAGNGYQADLHDFQLTNSGSAWLTAYALVTADLSSYGGPRNGILQDAIVQEVDVPTGLVMFEWHAYGHVSISDSYSTVPHYSNEPYDYFHVNSISPDPWGDGNFLISSRNTWAAYEINHVTGAIDWRLGGRHSSFKMGAGTGTAWQHDVRWQPDRTLTIFDNGATPKVHSESRILRERINWSSRSVSLVSRYVGKITSGSQGNDQVLANGNSFVGWGEEPYLTEFSPAGQIVFSGHFPAPGQSYRAYRFPWSAAPATRPALAVKPGAGSAVTVYASWNGATAVAAWQLLAGSSVSALAVVAQAPRSGFETALQASTGASTFAVQALGAEGQVLGTSNPVGR